MKQTTTNRATQCLLLAVSLSIATSLSAAVPENSIGTEGVFYLRTTGSAIEVKPFEKRESLLIRIADVTREQAVSIYEIRYIGFIAGEYDLRDYLRQIDGTDLSSVPPAKVSIVSVLPASHDGELGAIERSPLPFAWPYRILLAGAVLLWLIPLVWWKKQRMSHRKRVTKEVHPPNPSLSDQLKPLVEAALDGRSSPREQATLERLLLSFWREKLNLNECGSQQALASMRAHREAGALLRQVDAWLHMPPGRREIDVPALLAPYRNVTGVSPIDSFSKSAEVPA
ncbi:MAG TPA: hypothetical protein VMM76_13035 [Pirellulaceae bacterium]|nr:hypothetical protein [Pirellulaceae bacterium]